MLAFACAFTMFAGAAFTDQADIQQTEAVDMLTALGVIDGYEDGSFRPDATITRAEAAKMIYTIRNGGNDNADAFADAATTFTDLTNDWYKGYVKYCQAMGIISGKSTTTFDPNGTVTGTELAKMLLVTLGYDPIQAGLEGTGWDQKTLGLASENGLLDDVTCSLSAACPRGFAAQIMYNAINADTVTLENGEYVKKSVTQTDYETRETGEKTYSYSFTGKKSSGEEFSGDGYASYTEATETAKAMNGGTAVTVVTGTPSNNNEIEVTRKETKVMAYVPVTTTAYETLGEKFMDLVTSEIKPLTSISHNDNGYVIKDFTKIEKDYADLIGLNVKVLYKSGETDKVYGVYATGKVIATAAAGDMESADSGNKVKVDGVEYRFESGTVFTGITATAVNTATTLTGIGNIPDEYMTKLIDNDDNGKVDTVVYMPVKTGKVTYVGADTFSVSDGLASSEKYEDVTVYDGIAKDDYVVVTDASNTSNDKDVFEKATTINGKVTGKNGDELLIDGTWYDKAGNMMAGSETPALDDTVTAVIVNGYYTYITVDETGSTDLLYMSANAAYDSLTKGFKANVTFGDGRTETISVTELDDTKGASLSTIAADSKGSALYTYSKKSDGTYDLDTVSTSVRAGYDAYVANPAFVAKSGNTAASLGGLRIADDAVMFVEDSDGDVKLLTGADVNNWNSGTADASASLTKVVNGYTYVKAGFLKLNSKIPNATSDDVYGYIVDEKIYEGKIDGSTYTYFTVWTSEGEQIEVHESGSKSYAAGDIIKFTKTADNEVENVQKFATSGTAVDGVTPFSAAVLTKSGNKVVMKGATGNVEVETTSDTKVIYINSKDKVKADGTDIPLATETATAGTYDYNVVALYDAADDNKLLAIFVDSSNKLDGSGLTAPATVATKVQLTGIATAVSGGITGFDNISVTISDGTAVSDDVTLAIGTTITVKATVNGGSVTKGFDVKVGSDIVATVADKSFADDEAVTVSFNVTKAGAVTFAAHS